MNRALIVSDGKPGHVNQSIALCKHLGFEYETLDISYKSKTHKARSYLLDHLNLYSESLFTTPLTDSLFSQSLSLIVSTGSTTYYANKLLARKLGLPNIAILYPQGYRLNFSHIFCPFYDHPPNRNNITELPLNLCAVDETFFNEKTIEFKTKHIPVKPAVGIIIGGPNAISEIDAVEIQCQLEQIFETTEGMEHWVTTSRRTPKRVESVIDGFKFDYKLINSRDSYNPIPAFIQLCDRLFVTSDSASMISECASFGTAKVDVLMTRQLKTPNKFEELIGGLEKRTAIHVFEGTPGEACTKMDLGELLRKKTAFLSANV